MEDELKEKLESQEAEQVDIAENAEPGTEEEKKERVFTQAELDEIIAKRLEREREATTKRVAQESRDSFIADQGHVWNGKPIKTEAEYKAAIENQNLVNQYREKDLPDDVIHELVEGKTIRKQYEADQQTKANTTRIQNEFESFIGAFPGVKAEEIPKEVWDAVSNGESLVNVYSRHENQSLKQRLATLEFQRQTEDQNESNANSSTGSTKGMGNNKPVFYTAEQVKKMSNAEVDKNWTAIMESQKKW